MKPIFHMLAGFACLVLHLGAAENMVEDASLVTHDPQILELSFVFALPIGLFGMILIFWGIFKKEYEQTK